MSELITPEQQRLVIEKLHRSQDSIASLKAHNNEYGSQLGKLGDRTIPIKDFGRMMKQTRHKSFEVERHTQDITGHSIDLERL